MKTNKLIFKFTSIIATFVISYFVYIKIYLIPELKDQGPMLYNLTEYQWHNDVLYFGESSNFWIADSDKDRRTISDMINDSIDGYRLSGIAASGSHAGNFLPVIEQINQESRVKHLVITLNLRSFDKPWIYSNLESNLNRINCFYDGENHLFNRLKAAFQFYQQPSEKEQEMKMLNAFEFDTLKVDFPLKFNTIKTWCEQEKFPLPGGGEDFPKRELADHYIKAYAFQIDVKTNPRIKDFDDIVEVCKRKKIQLFFNLMSENIHYADSLVGKELVYLMKNNRDLLVDRYRKKGVIIIDNLETVNANSFGEKNWTTEHYDEIGRMKIAMNVKDTLMKYLPKKQKMN